MARNVIRNRIVMLGFATALASGGAAAIAHTALAGGDDSKPPTSSPAAPVSVQRNIPGVGTVSFTLDPTTGAVSNIAVTTLPGVTVGTPVTMDGKIQIPATLADGSTRTITIKVEREDGVFGAEVELEDANEAPEADTTDANKANENEPAEAPEPPETEQEHRGAAHPEDAHDNGGTTVSSAPEQGSNDHTGDTGGSGHGDTGGDHGSDGGSDAGRAG